ncbi:MAG: hypothetical protein K6U74_02415 [Firmicutes bacterium]|nr:hypothetical protein [Bacillota bacterium]
MPKASGVISYQIGEEFYDPVWEEKHQEGLRRKKNKENTLRGIAEYAAAGEKELVTMYYIAYQTCYRKIPNKDLEDIIQEILTAYIAKDVKEEFMLYLIAKEKIVQYYRRGRIENRNYRNILLTKQYFMQKDGNINWYSKYNDSELEEVNYEITLEEEGSMEFEEIALDRLFIETLPKRHKELAFKRFCGKKLSDSERAELSRYQRKLRNSIQ